MQSWRSSVIMFHSKPNMESQFPHHQKEKIPNPKNNKKDNSSHPSKTMIFLDFDGI